MPSIRSRLIRFLMKNRHLFRFKLKEESIDWHSTDSILPFRKQCKEGARRFGKVPSGIEIHPVMINGLTAEWIIPPGSTTDRVIFFVHGGGYVSGSCSDHRIHAAKFVNGTGRI
jgi:epsilon-lactone hydrolase